MTRFTAYAAARSSALVGATDPVDAITWGSVLRLTHKQYRGLVPIRVLITLCGRNFATRWQVNEIVAGNYVTER